MPAAAPSRSPLLPRFLARPGFRYGLGILAATLLSVPLFDFVGMPIFQRIGMPHEFCYLREPRLVWLHVVTDFLIGISYLSISVTLAYLAWKASKGIPFHWVFLAFGLFIVACGFTHFMEVVVVWHPMYWLSGYVKVVTAAASVATAIVLVPLVPKVLALVRQARQAEASRLEIMRLNQDLERFNSSVAHDLRAPLRGIAAFNQILVEDHSHELSPEAKDYLRRMQGSVARMDALITDLLKYATIGRQEISLRTVDLDHVLRDVLVLMDAEIARAAARVETAGPLPRVHGDALLLQVVFQNLIGNAIKFVPPGVTPRVVISAVSTDDGAVELSFTDNGVGVPADARERIFGVFERLDPRQPGTGMGLALTQRATDRLQGRIGVEPADPGPGSRFWVRLRAAPERS